LIDTCLFLSLKKTKCGWTREIINQLSKSPLKKFENFEKFEVVCSKCGPNFFFFNRTKIMSYSTVVLIGKFFVISLKCEMLLNSVSSALLRHS
jgi:hypothetical protein